MEKELNEILKFAIRSKRYMSNVKLDRIIRLLDQGSDFNKNKSAEVINDVLCNQEYFQESKREYAIKKLVLKGSKVELSSIFNIFNLPKATKKHLITMTDLLVNYGGLDIHALNSKGLNVLHSLCRRHIGPDLVIRS